MARSSGTTRKKRKPKPKTPWQPTAGTGAQIGMRWHQDDLEAIDDWRAQQDDKPDRAEAIRRLVRQQLGLTVLGVYWSPGERAAITTAIGDRTFIDAIRTLLARGLGEAGMDLSEQSIRAFAKAEQVDRAEAIHRLVRMGLSQAAHRKRHKPPQQE